MKEPSSARIGEAPSIRAKTFIEWSDSFSIGVQTVDEQHKGLVAMLNEINDGINGGWGKQARDEVLNKLVEYTVVNFNTEESLMTISNYSGLAAHKQHHEQLIAMVKEYLAKYEKDPSASNYDLLFFLKRWLVEHIMKDDKAMGEYLVKQGVGKTGTSSSWFARIKQWLGFGG